MHLARVDVRRPPGRAAARRSGRRAGTSARGSWQASMMVVPCSRSPLISSSTWAAALTPREAVGSSSSSSRGWRAIARATATSWRWPPDSERTFLVVSGSGISRLPSSVAASAWNRTSDIRLAAALPAEQQVRRDVQVVAERQVLPDHRRRPPGRRRPGCGLTGRPASRISPAVGAMSPAMQRTSVVLPAPFSPASATTSPGRICRSTPSSARSGPKSTTRSDTDSSGGAVGA